MKYESLFENQLNGPDGQIIYAEFVRKFRQTMLDLQVPPGIWCAGESQPETDSRLMGYADRIAFHFREHLWAEIRQAWDRGIMRANSKDGFSIIILNQWLSNYLVRKEIKSDEPESPEMTPEELLSALYPYLSADLDRGESLSFANPGAGEVWKLIRSKIDPERLKQIQEEVRVQWLEKLKFATSTNIREGETEQDYVKRLLLKHKPENLPSGKIMERKAIFAEYRKLREFAEEK